MKDKLIKLYKSLTVYQRVMFAMGLTIIIQLLVTDTVIPEWAIIVWIVADMVNILLKDKP